MGVCGCVLLSARLDVPSLLLMALCLRDGWAMA